MMEDEAFMRLAIEEAEQALAEGNPPFGAVVVRGGQVIARGHNLTVSENDPTAHGEVVAIRSACRALTAPTLEDATLYTTCEPCLLCTGAVMAAKMRRVVIGATWSEAPAYFNNPQKGSLLSIAAHVTYPFEYTTGILREDCLALYTGEL